MPIEKKPELVLPAASMDMLKAAIFNGADAVYCGVKKFNARIRAGNFTMQELKDAIDICHLHGKKIYLTLNILLKDSELEGAIGIAKEAYCMGIDAVIVQDLGLVRALHELLPQLQLHASTQMTCHNTEGALFLQELGVKRIVLARELSLREIKEIRERRNVEIECFVHGALCFSYSGQCLFSSFAFNKSGNRGLCLQPCRLAYSLQSKDGKESRKGYVLSMKDLMTIGKMKELIDAGIGSFKVEGRLKGVEYVAAVAKAYRTAIDACFGVGTGPSKEDVNLMKIAFMREPSAGYFFNGKEMISQEASARKGIPAAKVLGFRGRMVIIKLSENLSKWARLSAVKGDTVKQFSAVRIFHGSKEVKRAFRGQTVAIETGKKPFLEKEQELYFTSSKFLRDFAYGSIKKMKPVSYALHVIVREGEPLKATAKFNNREANIVSSFVPEESKALKTTAELIKSKLLKSNEFFKWGTFTCTIAGNPFLPLSELKKFKNHILHEMREALFAEHRRQIDEKAFNGKLKELLSLPRHREENRARDFVIFADRGSQLKNAVENADIIVCYDSIPEKEIEELKKRHPDKEIYVKISNIQSDAELAEFGKKFISKGAKIVCSNLGALNIAIKKKAHFWADRELNIFNSLAAKLLLDLGAQRIIPSIECSLRQLEEFAFGSRLVPLVFFYPALMTSKAYAKAGLNGEYVLQDRKGFKYRAIVSQNGIIRIYNPVPVNMLPELEKFRSFPTIAIDLAATESKEAADALANLAKKKCGKKIEMKSKFTRGHYEKEVE